MAENKDVVGTEEMEVQEEQKKRQRKSKEELLKEINKKIEHHEKCLANLKKKKEDILNPKISKAAQAKLLLEKVEEKGLDLEEVAKKLGITL